MAALAMLLDALGDDVLRVAEDVRSRVRALEHLAPLLVNDLPLLVHYVVVLDHVFAGVEVHALDLLLGAGNRTRDPRVLDRFDFEAVHEPADPIRGRPEYLHQVVFQRDEEAARPGVALPPRPTAQLVVDAPALVTLGADDVKPAHVRHTRAEHDVRASTGHVRCNRDGAGLASLGDDAGLALVLLCVEDVVLDAAFFEHARQPLGLLHRDRAHEHGPLRLVHLDDLIDDRVELRLLRLVDQVGAVDANHLAVGGNDHHVKTVDFVKLLGLGQRGTCHARKLLVLPEVVLHGDGRDRFLLLLDLDPFFGLDRLVQAVGPAAARHGATRELVDDNDLAVLDQVVPVAQKESLGFQRLVDLVRLDHVLEVVDVADAGPALHLRDAGLCQRGGLVLEVDLVVLTFGEAPRPAGVLVVLLGGFVLLTKN